MFLNINENGNKELLIPIKSPEYRFNSTAAIGINNYKTAEGFFLAVELINHQLEKEYVYLCFDLVESSRSFNDEFTARKALFDTFKKWYNLLANARIGILPENEIRGLMGELSLIIELLDCGRDDGYVIEAWKTHKDSSRDFIFDDTWYEVKTIELTKDYVTISSIEQLDQDTDGKLRVYKIIRTREDDPKAVNLNCLVQSIKERIGTSVEADFNRKVLSKGYVYNERYDSFVYRLIQKNTYNVDGSFPRLYRSQTPIEIINAKYDIRLSDLENWRENGQG